MQADALYEMLVLSDETVAKALKLGEVSQIARIETRLRDFLNVKWNILAKKAVKAATAKAKKGSSGAAVAAAVHKLMKQWAKQVAPQVRKELARVYKLAKTAGHKKGTKQTKASLQYDTPHSKDAVEVVIKADKPSINPSFDVVDEEAMAALGDDATFWVGEHYDKNVSEAVSQTAKDAVIAGGGDTAKAAKIVEAKIAKELGKVAVPGGFHGSSVSYFEGLVANAATAARVWGQARAFIEIGITTVEIVNPEDERTCPVCSHLNGKVFTIEQIQEQMDAEMAAKTPDQIKKIHPWLSPSQLKGVSSKAGPAGAKDAKSLADAGIAAPPYHFRCRCTIDISEEAGSFDALAA